MANAPELPLDNEAAVERCHEHVRKHARVTWRLLFPPNSVVVQSLIDGYEDAPPRASILVELRDYSSALFDCYATQHTSLAVDESSLESCLEAVAAGVMNFAIEETDDRFKNVRTKEQEREKIIGDHLRKRVEHWVGLKRTELARLNAPPRREEASPIPVRGRVHLDQTDEDPIGPVSRAGYRLSQGKPSINAELHLSQKAVELSPATIGERLDKVVLLEQSLTHEELAHRIGISRSRYFEVKAGRGGKKSKAKTELYLSLLLSDT